MRKEIEELTNKLGQQQSVVQDTKENIKQEVIKEEENLNTETGNVQVKEEQTCTPVKKEEEESEVCTRICKRLKKY